MGNKALVPLELYTSGSNPTVPTPPEGAIYYNSTANEIRMYSGSTWYASVNTETAQTIAGEKTFSSAVFSNNNSGFTVSVTGDLYQAAMRASSTNTIRHFEIYNDGSGTVWSVDGRGRFQEYDGVPTTTKGELITGGTGGARLLSVGADGSSLTADSSTNRGAAWVDNLVPIIFTVNGQLGVAAGVARVGVEGNYTIKGVRARVDTASTGTSIKVDIHKNGTTLWSTQTNRPDIAVSTNASSYVTNMNTTTLVSGDYLTMDVDQIGSTIAGSHLTVTVWMVRTS